MSENKERNEIVKTVKYCRPKSNEWGRQEIHMETNSGLKTPKGGWYISHEHIQNSNEFLEAAKKIQSGDIKPNVRVVVRCNNNGEIISFT